MPERTIPSLGGTVGCWIQDHCAIPDGERRGEPFLLTSDQWRFLLHFYALDSRGEFIYRRGGLRARPAKEGKSPLAAAIITAEAAGPVRFAGWEDGEPTGRTPPSPWIQVAAVSEDQTANTWRALVPMLQLGGIAHEIEDVGLSRVNLPGGGRIEFVTAAHRSRVGQRVTFAVLDELGFWLPGNHGHELADAIMRNLAGMGGRFLGTTNAWAVGDESVAERLAEGGAGVYVDDAEPGSGSIRNKAERRRMLHKVYGDSARGCEAQGNGQGRIEPWIDLERIEVEIESLIARGDAAQAERFFLNRKRATTAAAFDPERWRELADFDHEFHSERKASAVVDGRVVGWHTADARIVIAVDGARFVDALAAIATEVETGYQFVLGIWERPEDASDDYEHPLDEVDGAISEAFDRFTVCRLYVDPQYIEPLVDTWQARWGERRVFPWYTNRPRQMTHAVRTFAEAIAAGDLSHDGDDTFARHVANASRRLVNVYDDEQRQMFVIAKDRRGSPRKVDAAVAAVISWEAMRDERQGGSGGYRPPARASW